MPNCGPGWQDQAGGSSKSSDAQAGQPAHREDAADGDRHQRGDVGADRLERDRR